MATDPPKLGMARYVLALDQGTTSSRSIVFDESGEVVALDQEEFEQIFPQPGWVEHDPEEIWQTQLKTARIALEKAGIGAESISGIGITNQRETTVVWDRITGKPIANAIVWQDRRTADFCDRLKADSTAASLIRERTGLVIDAYFSGSKINWLLENIPGAREAANQGRLAFGTIDTWLAWNLSGGELHITDPSNASRTMLCRIDNLTWDEELLEILSVPSSLLPEIRSSSEPYGSTDPSLLGAAIPIAGIAGDQQAALFGQACHRPGMAKNTYGTGCFLLLNTGSERIQSKQNLLTTVAWQLQGQTEYALEGSVFIGGAAIQWLRDQLGIIRDASEVETLARSVESSEGVYFVPAFAGLGAPHWDPLCQGQHYRPDPGIEQGPPRAGGTGGNCPADLRPRRGHGGGCRDRPH